jgi:dihydroflavonol-4-reductase
VADVFVTGGTGFIGRALVSTLCDEGHGVVALVRSGDHQLSSAVRPVIGDLTNPDALGDAGRGCRWMLHLAGFIGFQAADRPASLAVNGGGTAAALALAARWGVERTVVVSSACTVGFSDFPDRVLDETHRPTDWEVHASPYLEGKLAGETAALAAATRQSVVVVNPTTVYGPGDRTMNSGALIRQVAVSPVFPIFPGGTNAVDVRDVVQGILCAARHGRSGERYILGGANFAFRDVFKIVSAAVDGRTREINVPAWSRPFAVLAGRLASGWGGSRFLNEVILRDLYRFKYFSSRKALEDLGWEARISFSETVRDAYEWYRAHGLIGSRPSDARS